MAGIARNYALAELDPEPLIEQIANGAYLRDIAEQTGFDKRRLSEVLRKHPGYVTAKECAVECQLDKAEKELADKESDIARAREVWRAATWRAEREVPHRWGARTQVTIDQRVSVEVSLSEDAAVLLDSVRIQHTAPQQTPETDVSDAQQIMDT